MNPNGWARPPGCDASIRPVDSDREAVEGDADQSPKSLSAAAPGGPAMGVPSTSGQHIHVGRSLPEKACHGVRLRGKGFSDVYS